MEETVADADVTVDGSDEPEPAIGPGTVIGRYVVLSLLGRGGMGVVVAAYDPELDRKVALKLLRPRGGSASAARTRLQREAQALAKLDHPNVVGVHDVGVHHEQLFVAMEFVDGRTLGDWLPNKSPRPWREVVRVFVEAGLGLAAAHEAGLVHRDFKPDNVMIGDDGRVRVMDFGLARSESGSESGDEQPIEPTHVTSTSATIDRLTQTGTMLGTPAYMSLEQFEGGTIDARSDQFSFCVALYEGLYGQRPFPGRTVAQIAAAVERGEIEDPPRSGAVPSWLRRALVRGLARAPEQRWPTMRALLSALTDDPAVRRRKVFAIAGLLGLLAAAVAGVVVLVQQDAHSCTGMDERLHGIWDEDRRSEVEAALLGTGLGHAGGTWTRVEQRLDDYADAWAAARTEACEATHRGEQSGELLDLRMACLDERLDHLRAAVDVLARADATVAGQAVALVAALPSLDRCADQSALTAELPPPDDPHTAELVAALDRTLVDARALERAGKYDEGLALADDVLAASTGLGYSPLHARALLRQGSLQEKIGDYVRAEATLGRAYSSALSQRMLSHASAAAAALMFLVGDTLTRTDEGLRWAIDADALSLAVGDDESRGVYLNNRGALAEATGDYELARGYYEQALARLEAALGPEAPSVGKTRYNLGNVAISQNQLALGRAHYQRALEILEASLGPEHPEVAGCLVSLGNLAIELDEYESARTNLERSLHILESALGPEHPEIAATLNGLGGLADMRGDFRTARDYYERTLTVLEAAFGPENPHVATVRSNLASVAAALEEHDEARRQYERALAIREAAFGPEHPEVANARFALARALWSAEPERARELAELARRSYASIQPPPPRLAELDAWLTTH
jgi:tetratricopeptide (TPR) repeat protein/predicted Ser/Thr protein kinase